jgi:hypothetical protein
MKICFNIGESKNIFSVFRKLLENTYECEEGKEGVNVTSAKLISGIV